MPLLALFHLEFVPGPVIFASLGLSLLMTLVGRDAIKRVHLHTVSIGLIIGMLIGAISLSRLAPRHLGAMFGLLILLAVLLTELGIRLPFTTPNSLIAAAVSGFMGMTAAVPPTASNLNGTHGLCLSTPDRSCTHPSVLTMIAVDLIYARLRSDDTS